MDAQRANESTYDYMERLYHETTGRPGGRRAHESREAAAERGQGKRVASGPSGSSTAAPPVKRGAMVGFTGYLNISDRESLKCDGMRDPEVRDWLEVLCNENKRKEMMKYVTTMRSDVVDRRFIEDLDNRNVKRLARFEKWTQDLFVRTFHAKEDVRSLNAHVGAVLERLRHSAERGLTEDDGERLVALWECGVKVSVNECDQWPLGKCKFGARCRYFHIGPSGSAIDELEGNVEERGRPPAPAPKKRASGSDARRVDLDDDDL